MNFAHDYAVALNRKFSNLDQFSEKNFDVKPGRKFDKIVQFSDFNPNSRSIHAYVDKITGDLYKPDGVRPAKDARYKGSDLHTNAINNADVYGAYLYKYR